MLNRPRLPLRTISLLCSLLACAGLAACSGEEGSGDNNDSSSSSGGRSVFPGKSSSGSSQSGSSSGASPSGSSSGASPSGSSSGASPSGSSSGGDDNTSSSGGSSSGGNDSSSSGGGSSSGGSVQPADCTVITVDDANWGSVAFCGDNNDEPCADWFDSYFSPAIDNKRTNYIDLELNLDEIDVGGPVDIANNPDLILTTYSTNATSSQADDNPVLFVATSGSFTLNSINPADAEINASLSNVTLFEATYSRDTGFTLIENGRCLQFDSSSVVVTAD